MTARACSKKCIAIIVALAADAAADPDPVVIVEPGVPTEPPRPAPQPPPPDVSRAPLPGNESGRTDVVDRGDSTARSVFRGILFVPKLAIDVVLAPVRGGLWVTERYSLIERYKRIFFSDDRTIGFYPSAWYETGYGFTAGATFFDHDLFGEHEHLTLSAEGGGKFHSRFELAFRTGRRLGDRFELITNAKYEKTPREFFFGIGNGDKIDPPGFLIDPLVSDLAVETRFHERLERALVIGDVWLWDALHVRPAASIADATFGRPSRGTPVPAVYNINDVIGFGGTRHVYTEVALQWDDRGQGAPLEPPSLYATGSFANVFGGRVTRIDGEGGDYWRYGADLQQFFRIAEAPRVVSVWLHGEAVSGSLDDVPFNELPRLGGTRLLRGYQVERFRDRIAAVGSVEYMWDLSRFLAASLFIDVGRVYRSFSDLSVDNLRMGYGIAFEGHTDTTYLLTASIASSIDGGVFFNLSFDPVFDITDRVRRR